MTYEQLLQDLNLLFTQFKEYIIGLIPKLIGALIILVIGFLFARLVKSIVNRLIKNLDRIFPNKKIKARIKQMQLEKTALLISKILYWMLIVLFLTAATEILGLPIITTWLTGLMRYLPNILIATIIVFVGIIGGKLLRELIISTTDKSGFLYSNVLGRIVQYSILLICILIAVDQIGIDIAALTDIINIILAALLFSAALAFGLGSKTSVSNILASHYFKNRYHEGQIIRIGDIEGKILEITPTTVIVDTTEGKVTIPAKKFSENFSILVKSKES